MNNNDVEVITGGNRNNGNNKNSNPWDQDFSGVNFSDIDRILETPGIDNFGGIAARANFRNEEERIAYMVTYWNLKKLGLTSRIEFLADCLKSTLGIKGFGKTLQLQAKTDLAMPTVMREQLGLTTIKGKEDKVKKSDFKNDKDSQEDK